MENKTHFYSLKNREVKKRLKNNDYLQKSVALFEKYNFTCIFRYSDKIESYNNGVITACQDKRILITGNRSDEAIINGIALIIPETMRRFVFNNYERPYCIHSTIETVEKADIEKSKALIDILL